MTSDLSLAQNVLAYTLLADGVPIVYYGQEQRFNGASDPTNREALWLGEGGFDTSSPLYKLVSQLNQIRNQAIFDNEEYLTYNNWAIYSDTSTIAMRKGEAGSQIVTVLSNLGANGASYTLSLPATDTGFTANEALVEVLSCSQVTTDGSGNLAVVMGYGLPKVCSFTAKLESHVTNYRSAGLLPDGESQGLRCLQYVMSCRQLRWRTDISEEEVYSSPRVIE